MKAPSPTSLPEGKGKIMVWTGHRSRKVSPCREANNRKAKYQSLSNQIFFYFKLFSLNDHALYGKPVREGTGSWLVAPLLCFEFAQQFKCAATRVAPLLCFEPAQQLKQATASYDKVSCRQQHRQQAADVPHSALAARVLAPASSLKA